MKHDVMTSARKEGVGEFEKRKKVKGKKNLRDSAILAKVERLS